MKPTCESASVLYIEAIGTSPAAGVDPAGATEVDMAAFLGVSGRLTEIASQAEEYQRAQAAGVLRACVLGRGLLVVFAKESPATPLRCALQIAEWMRNHSDLSLRMVVHLGLVTNPPSAGVGETTSVPASVVRIASQGEAEHILVSADVVNALAHEECWAHVFRALADEPSWRQGEPRVYTLVAPASRAQAPRSQVPSAQTGPQDSAGCAEASPAPAAVHPAVLRTRWVAVSYSASERGESLIYATHGGDDRQGDSAPAFVETSRASVRGATESLMRKLHELTVLALQERPRGEVSIESTAATLARLVLPSYGLQRMVGVGVHPQFQLIQEITAQIPWEALEETYSVCCGCGRDEPSDLATNSQPARYCRNCGQPMRQRGGKLAVETCLSLVVPGREPRVAKGHHFFLFEDPSGNLCDQTHDPGRVCLDHFGQIEYLLTEAGYQVSRFRGLNVTCDRVLDALEDPEVVGIYYYGHGRVDDSGSALCLADGVLSAGRLANARVLTPFIFINACQAAAGGEHWGTLCQPSSLATALARPSQWRSVIAPTTPVVNSQAARLAVDFFRRSCAPDFPVGEAIRRARLSSFERYREGQPDIAWAVYRFFGDPQRSLPAPLGGTKVGARAGSILRIFDDDGSIRHDRFAFAIEEILSRSIRRANSCRRSRVSVLDFITGLLSCGDLTRYLLRQQLTDPDVMAARLSVPLPFEPSPSDTQTGVAPGQRSGSTALPLVHERAQLESDLVRIWRAADRLAQHHREGEQRITEQDVLSALLADATWDRVATVECRASELRGRLAVVRGRREVDENGRISLAGLAPEARRIIETAHGFAQQRGASHISHRLLLAAFAHDPSGHVATICRRLDMDPQEVMARLLGANDGEPLSAVAPPRDFGLSPEVCDRIVSPVLEHSRRKVQPGAEIAAADLFDAFCEAAAPTFVRWLATAQSIDLSAMSRRSLAKRAHRNEEAARLGGFEPLLAQLTSEAAMTVRAAHALAEHLGVLPISNCMILAAFLERENGYAVQLIRQELPDLKVEAIRDRLIERCTLPGRESQRFPLNREACEAAVSPMLERAAALGTCDRTIGERELFRAFCAVAPPEFRQALLRRDWGLDLDRLSLADTKPPAAAPEVVEPPSAAPDPERATPATDGQERSAVLPGIRLQDFDDEVVRCLRRAVDASCAQGWREMRSPHLFLGMLDEELPIPQHGVLSSTARAEVRRAVLAVIPPRPHPAPRLDALSANVIAILRRTLLNASNAGRSCASVDDLLQAFFSDGGGIVGTVIARLGTLGLPNPVC